MVEEYDPAKNVWTKKSNLLTARNAFSASVVNGEIYAIGGYAGTEIASVEKYNWLLDMAQMPQAVDAKKVTTMWGRIKTAD